MNLIYKLNQKNQIGKFKERELKIGDIYIDEY